MDEKITESQKIKFEKFAILIALEAEKKGFPNKSMLESRAGFLARPYSDRILSMNKPDLSKVLQGLISYERSKPPEITLQGKKELYNSENSSIILKLLGKTMEDIGNQFIGYGEFMNRITERGKQEHKISLDQFQEILRQAYNEVNEEEPRFHGTIPLDILKIKISKKTNLANETMNKFILDLENNRIVDLQIAYDASSIKDPQYGINIPGRGLIYFLSFRV